MADRLCDAAWSSAVGHEQKDPPRVFPVRSTLNNGLLAASQYSPASCQCTKSLRDSGEVRLVLSINPSARSWVAGEARCLEDRGVNNLIKTGVAYDNRSYHPDASAYDRRYECAQALRRHAAGPHPRLQAVRGISEAISRDGHVRGHSPVPLHLAETGVSICTRNITMTGLRFLFRVTLRRLDLAAEMYHLRAPQKIPLVISTDEAKRLLAVADSLKARVMLSLGYGCGLRAGEVVRLKVKHIDSAQKIIRVEKAKGRKDRNATLITSGSFSGSRM